MGQFELLGPNQAGRQRLGWRYGKTPEKPADMNSMAAAIVGQATGTDEHGGDPYEGKDPKKLGVGLLLVGATASRIRRHP